MSKFALVGKDIGHSKSPEIYRRLISPSIEYDLLDYEKEELIPTAENLLAIYDGINITSPYKRHFLDLVEISKNSELVGAVNCLKKKGGSIKAENTDFLAILDISKKLKSQYGDLEIIVLGDGVMSHVTQVALKKNEMPFVVLSRKKTEEFGLLNFVKYFKNSMLKPLIINTCSRDYVFEGEISKNTIFWDYNYNHLKHSQTIPDKVDCYIDGASLLELQAKYAVSFWQANS